MRTLSHVKFDAESDDDIDFHRNPKKTIELDLSQNIITLKNSHAWLANLIRLKLFFKSVKYNIVE